MPRRTSLTNSISQKALIQWAEEAFDLTVSQTTISRLLADSKRISQRGLVDGCKRNRAVKYPLVEKALKEWFEIYQGRIPITGDVIKTKAACFMTALYRAQQDRSLATQLLMGRKSDKERLSIVICPNENGTDKLPLWVIGSAKQPRDHRRNHGGNIEQYGIKWRTNKKSWMTTILFQE
ncbi:hypothetical protein K3495_g8874 [Podosphaera aphanis]|nr:hypothetical protein K3495_g8874 [Podosphaera aphanis]